jgi:tetraacyldisaccharide 4'-kinase
VNWEGLWYGPATPLTHALRPVSWLYGAGARAWHLAWDLGLRTPVRFDGVQVISVGNLVVGGAGKTPVVILLAQEALAAGKRVAVLTRGYGRADRALRHFDATALPPVELVGDEPRLIARRCPGVTVWVGADRVESARRAVAAGAEVLLLDDGFQHRRLARDVNVLLDGGDDNGLLLPAGPLREPPSARARATEVWRRGVDVAFEVTGVRQPSGPELPVTALRGQRVVLLLGVARPGRVEATVKGLGAEVLRTFAHGDHHRFTDAEREAAAATAQREGAWLVTTEKDAERLPEGAAHVLLYGARRVRRG